MNPICSVRVSPRACDNFFCNLPQFPHLHSGQWFYCRCWEVWPGHGHPLPDADSQGCRGCSGSPWYLGPARLGKTPTWSTSVSGGLHTASLQGKWVYSALSYQSVLSSSCHIVAGRNFSNGKQKQDRVWDTTMVTRSPECQAGGLVRQGC